ncbi:MAG: hypothetical protein KDK48_06555, partial [Chlamydiia bacterium]|nr:hypothetical protein [Chlamydiia bacterium]
MNILDDVYAGCQILWRHLEEPTVLHSVPSNVKQMFGEPLPIPYLTDQVAKNAFLSLGAAFLAGALAVPLCGLFVSL